MFHLNIKIVSFSIQVNIWLINTENYYYHVNKDTIFINSTDFNPFLYLFNGEHLFRILSHLNVQFLPVKESLFQTFNIYCSVH